MESRKPLRPMARRKKHVGPSGDVAWIAAILLTAALVPISILSWVGILYAAWTFLSPKDLYGFWRAFHPWFMPFVILGGLAVAAWCVNAYADHIETRDGPRTGLVWFARIEQMRRRKTKKGRLRGTGNRKDRE